jgi:hypothetical protein
MFHELTNENLRAAHDAAVLLYSSHRALGIDVIAIKLDTLRVDIALELSNRGVPVTPPGDGGPAGARASVEPRAPQGWGSDRGCGGGDCM